MKWNENSYLNRKDYLPCTETLRLLTRVNLCSSNKQKGFCSLHWFNSTTESTNLAVLRCCEAHLIYWSVDKWMRYMEVSFFLCSLQVELTITSLQVVTNYSKLTLTVTNTQVLTCCTNRVKKRVIIVGTDLSARKYDSVERHVVFRHKLMQSNLKKEYKIYDLRLTNSVIILSFHKSIREKRTVLFWQLLTNK